MLTTLTNEFVHSAFHGTDEAVREKPSPKYPWMAALA